MITYCSDGFRPIKHGEQGIDGPVAAAVAFAARAARRELAKAAIVAGYGSTALPAMVCTAVTRLSSVHRPSGTRPPATTCGSRSISSAIETPVPAAI